MGTVTQQFVYLFSYKLIWYYFAFLSISIDLFLKKIIYYVLSIFSTSMNKESMPQDIIFEISTTKDVRLVERYLSMFGHNLFFFFFAFFFLISERVENLFEFIILC
jgi:hypothetical protein